MADKHGIPNAWFVVSPRGVDWLGLARDERHAWTIALGWPDDAEIAHKKAKGWHAAQATVTWRKQGGSDV